MSVVTLSLRADELRCVHVEVDEGKRLGSAATGTNGNLDRHSKTLNLRTDRLRGRFTPYVRSLLDWWHRFLHNQTAQTHQPASSALASERNDPRASDPPISSQESYVMNHACRAYQFVGGVTPEVQARAELGYLDSDGPHPGGPKGANHEGVVEVNLYPFELCELRYLPQHDGRD